jgi:hypothetical protein
MASKGIRNHEDLKVWRLARSMAVDVYRSELETQSLLCEDLGLLAHNDDLHRQFRGIRLMLTSLQASLRMRARTC